MAENENKQPSGSRRMKILQQSLVKKQAAFDQRLQNHFDDVRSANGQPLNDKRNGQTTLNRWERQNDGLRTADKEIEKTQRAIEREQAAIDRVNNADIPAFLKPMIESGEITQWRKFPNRFFVSGVEKARIIWDKDKQQFGYAYLQGVKGEQFTKFRDTYNHILALHRQERKNETKQEAASEKNEAQPAQEPAEKLPEISVKRPSQLPTMPDFGLKGEDLRAFNRGWQNAADSLDAVIAKQSEKIAERIALLEKAGIPYVRMEAFMDKINGGEVNGYGEKHTVQRLTELEQFTERLRDKTMKPSGYIGTGYKNPRTTAFTALGCDIADTYAKLDPAIPYYEDRNIVAWLSHHPVPQQIRPAPTTKGSNTAVIQQSLEERLQEVQGQYEKRLSDMNADGQKKHRILEAGMENLIKGLPEQTQMQARLNFYQTQYGRLTTQKDLEQPPEQQELFYGR